VNTAPKKLRKLTRPTTPELEALFFRVAINLTKREMAILQWVMGRSTLDLDGLAALFNSEEKIG
jgi:hypothetical protein